MFLSDLYLILDLQFCKERSFLKLAEQALEAGVKLLQYRDKNPAYPLRLTHALELKSLCSSFGCTLIINDDVDLALAIEADGVHVGKEDTSPDKARKRLGSEKILGVTVRNVSQAIQAEKLGADYVGLGPIFQSSTKPFGKSLGCGVIQKVAAEVEIPIYAIGGISLERVREVISAGADGIALISGILGYPDVSQRTQKFIDLIRSAKQTQA